MHRTTRSLPVVHWVPVTQALNPISKKTDRAGLCPVGVFLVI